MDEEPWQVRLQAVGWDQKMLAKHLGLADNTVSSQLRGKYRIGVPRYIKAVIIGLERMTAEERQNWIDAVEREPKA